MIQRNCVPLQEEVGAPLLTCLYMVFYSQGQNICRVGQIFNFNVVNIVVNVVNIVVNVVNIVVNVVNIKL